MTIWSLVLLSLGTAIALEGLPYFVAPRKAQEVMRTLSETDPGLLRAAGFAMIAGGLLLGWLATR